MEKKETQATLKKGKSQFMLIGEAKINDYTFKIDNEYDSGWTDNQFNIGIDCGNGNVVYAELSGGYFPNNSKNLLYVKGVKTDESGKKTDDFTNSFTIDWDDRFDENIIETIAESSFITVGIEKDSKGKTFVKKFISGYDAVEYIKEHLENGAVLNVKGNIEYSGSDNTYIKKKITSVFLSKATPEEYKAVFTQTILLDSASIGKEDKEKNTIGLSAYTVDYVGKTKIDKKKVEVKKNFTFPVNFEVQIAENPEITSKMMTKYFKTKKGCITEITVEGNIIEGASVVNISDDDIPDDIKELISMGLYTEEEAKVKCAVGSTSREKRMVIIRPTVTYVGEGDNKKPTVAFDDNKYKETDLSFFSTFLANLEDNNSNDDTEIADTEDNEDEDLLNMLNNL